MRRSKAIVVWMTEESLQQLEQIRKYVESKNIELPEIVKIKELKGKINQSMLVRFCIKHTANHLSETTRM